MTQVFIIIIIVVIIIIIAVIKRKNITPFVHNLKERKRSRQLKIINRYRRKIGLTPLKAYYAMDKIAKNHCYYMAKHKACNHNGFSWRAMKVRKITGSGTVAENCYKFPARTYNDHVAEKLVKGWMKSSGHRRNLMNPHIKKIGIGIVTRKGYVYATQIFAS